MLTLGSYDPSSPAAQSGQFRHLPPVGAPTLCPPICSGAHLEDVVGTLAAQVVLAGQDHHGLGEHLQADGADELLLQVVHAVCIPEQRLETHREVHPSALSCLPWLWPCSWPSRSLCTPSLQTLDCGFLGSVLLLPLE